MNFVCRVVIDAPLEKVLSLFDDPGNFKKWQDGFIGLEHLSGNPGEPGAKTKLIYKTGRREIELIETIIKKDLPSEFSVVYETETMVNTMKSSFATIDIHQTEYIAELEYTKFTGLIPKMMALFTPGIFRKQTQKWLDQFKEFVEKEK